MSITAPSPRHPILTPIPSHTRLLLLLSQAVSGAVELQEERGCCWQPHPTEAATGICHHLIQELWVGGGSAELHHWHLDPQPHLWLRAPTDAGHRHSGLQHLDSASHSRPHAGEGGDGGSSGLGQRVQTQCGLSQEAQGALRAHEERGQVVASRPLPAQSW